MKLDGKNKKLSRYVTDITEPDLLSSVDFFFFGGGVILKIEVFVT